MALEPLYPWMHLAGRILFCTLFIMSGINHLMKMGTMKQYAASKGVPAAGLMVPLSGLMLLAGGLMVLLGWHRFIGAGLLFLFLVPTAFIMHAFWKEDDPQTRMNEMIHFQKDLALAGAALLIAVYAGEIWPLSL